MTDPLAPQDPLRRPAALHAPGPRRHPALRAAGLLLTGGLIGGVAVHAASPPPARPVAAASPAPTASVLTVPPAPPPAAPAAQLRPAAGPLAAEQVAAPSTAPPASVDLPTIGVRSDLVDLHLDAGGTLQAPPEYGEAGWYSDGVLPGDTGAPAVILGHVDSKTGPAIFYRLSSLKTGDPVLIHRTDGTQLRFEVYAEADFDKDAFPADDVYAAQPQPELRLITCTGTFDKRSGHYLGNHVVYAHEVPPADAAPAPAPAAPAPVPAAPAPPAPAPVPAAPAPVPAAPAPVPAAPAPPAPAPAPPAPAPAPPAPAPAKRAPAPPAPATRAPAPAPATPAPASPAPPAQDSAEAQQILKQFANSTDLAERRALLQRYAALTGRTVAAG